LQAAKEKAAQEKESYQRQMGMSRGADRVEHPQGDGWAVAGGPGLSSRPPPKAGDLSEFGQIKTPSMSFGLSLGPSESRAPPPSHYQYLHSLPVPVVCHVFPIDAPLLLGPPTRSQPAPNPFPLAPAFCRAYYYSGLGPIALPRASHVLVHTPPLPSALAKARNIDDLANVSYPAGVSSPKVELNIGAKDGKFRCVSMNIILLGPFVDEMHRYDRDFLLQFMLLCRDKPDDLPRLDMIGLEPSDQPYQMTRPPSGRHRQASDPAPPSSARGGPPVGLGISASGPSLSVKPGSMNNFNPMGDFRTTQKMSSEEQFALASPPTSASGGPGGAGGIPPNMQFRPSPMVRSASQGPGLSSNSGRTRSERGEKRDHVGKIGPVAGSGPGGAHQQMHGGPSGMGMTGLQGSGFGFEPVAPLSQSANAWSAKRQGPIDAESPEFVDRKAKGLLNRLTMERFDSISDQIIAWANKSEKEKDGRTLNQVIRLVFEKATDEAPWSEMYARLCRKMMDLISLRVQDDGIKTQEGKPIAGGLLFRKYLLNRCQEDFERGRVAKETTAAAAATKALEGQAAAHGTGGKEEVALYSEEYYAAQKAKRRGLGLIKFIGELFKLQMLTERIMHECIKKLLGNVENPEEEEIESLCKLLTTVGAILDTPKARGHMDVYFSRMKELTKSPYASSRMQVMLQVRVCAGWWYGG
jgi:translation initiation factor 4G